MNIKHIFATVSLLVAAGAAMAAPADLNFPDASVQQKSSVSREQVKAEVLTARAVGDLELSEVSYPLQRTETSGRRRADVRADLLASRAAGLLNHNETNYPVNYELWHQANSAVALQASGQ